MKKEMTSLALITSLVLASSAYAESQTQGQTQAEGSKSVEEKVDAEPDPKLNDCLKLVGKDTGWSKIAKLARSTPAEGAKFWVDVMNSNMENDKEVKEAKQPDREDHDIVEAEKSFKEREGAKYTKCVGYTFIMAAREEGFESGRVKRSGDGRVKCYNHGFHTMDYEACGKLVDAYDMASVAQMGLQAFQTIDFQKTTSDAGKEYLQDASNPTSGLEAQKKAVKKQAEIANTQAAFHAAKVAAMWVYYDKMPTEKDLTDNCNIYLNEAQSVLTEAEFLSTPIEELCALSAQGQVRFLANTQAKDDVKRIMAEETMNAVAKTAQGALLNKQAKKIKGAIDQVNAFDPSQVVMVPETPDLCLSNPNHEDCKIADTRTDVDLAGNGFTVTGDWGGTNATTRTEGDLDDSALGTSSTDSTHVGPSAIGSVVEDNSTPGGFAYAPPASGTVESGGSTTGGGGGGGGAGAVGLPSGGGGSGSGQGAGMMEEKTTSKLSYSGGTGSGRYAMTNKKTTSTRDSSKNPFDDLFGKKKSANGNNVLNFRDPASKEIGEKDGNSLFEMISNRYRVSQEKKRLIEYEVIEK